MSQMCPNCSQDNADNASTCTHCQESLLGLLGKNTMLDKRYQVTQVLGCGGFGAVYLAEDTRISGRQVAVKENRPDPTANPQAMAQTQQQFRAEVGLMIKLHHAGLPNVSDQFTEPSGRQYMVMDYIEGETLEDIVAQRGSLPEAEVIDLTQQLLDILEYLHNQQPPIVHRDVKPANIKRRPDGQIVLVDFGIAKVHGQGTQSWAKRAGTPGFAPLEQYGHGGASTDARSDIYSLGAVLYYLLTGQEPTPAPDLAAGASLTPPRKLKPQLSLEIQRVVFKAMAVNVNHRYQSVAEMRQALVGEASELSPPPPKKNFLPWIGVIIVGATVACLALVLIVAFNSEILFPMPTPGVSPTAIAVSGEVKAGASLPAPTETPIPPPGPTWTPTSTPLPADTWTPTPTPSSPATATPTPNYEPTIAAIVRRYSDEIKVDNTTYLDSSSLSEVLIDPVLEKQKRSACWLRNEGFYYTYSNRTFVIDSIMFDSDNQATVLAQIRENRKLLKQNGEVHSDYGYDDYRAIYQLQRRSNDKWYIYCFQALEDGDPISCEVKLEDENPCDR